MAKKQKNEPKKKKSGCAGGLILLIILILLLLFLMKHFGFGLFGDGNGKKSGSGSSAASDSVDKDDEGKENIVDITAWGSGQYRYEEGKIDLDEFIKTVQAMEGKVTVRISDDSSTENTMQELINALNEANIAYIEPSGIGAAETTAAP